MRYLALLLAFLAASLVSISEADTQGTSGGSVLVPCNATQPGIVPTPPNDTAQFLNGKCLWAPGTGGSGSITLSDGTHSGSVSSLVFGNGYLVSIAGSTGTVNGFAILPAAKTASYTALPQDMGQPLTLAATSGTPALTLNQSGSCSPTTCFAPGMTLTISVPKVSSSVDWSLTNSTGITIRGLNSTTLKPGTQGTFVVNFDGSFIDFFPGMQVAVAGSASTGTIGGVIPDGSSITITNGVVSVATGTSGAVIPVLNGNNAWSAGQAVTPDSATSCGTQAAGGTMTPNFANANSCLATFGAGNLTIANPTNVKAGQTYVIQLTQDSTGSRTVAWGGNFKCAGGCSSAITLSTAANAVDVLSCWASDTTHVNCAMAVKGAS